VTSRAAYFVSDIAVIAVITDVTGTCDLLRGATLAPVDRCSWRLGRSGTSA
jgi:hypothetical protein